MPLQRLAETVHRLAGPLPRLAETRHRRAETVQRGRVVAVLYDGALSAGAVRLALPSGLAPGVYAVAAEGAAERVSARWAVAQ